MEKVAKNIILENLNQADHLDILDPDGICSFVKFFNIEIKDSNIQLEFTFDPNGNEIEDVLSYKIDKNNIPDSEGNISEFFLNDLYKNFSEFIIENFRDGW